VWKRAAARLKDQLLDYEESPMPSRERYFLTERYFELTGRSDEFPIYDAECLALQFVDQLNDANLKRLAGLRRAKISGVWQHCEKVGNVASLYRTETVRQNLLGHAKDFPVPEGVSVKVFAPDEVVDCLVEVSLGSEFSDWRLALVATGGDPFVESSNQRKAVYLWIAGVTVAATCVLGWLLLSMLRQRMKLAQLKNDLVATVSHELKTPLASIRLLVDTLLQNEDLSAGASDQNRTTEYLQLISVENARLTRLVDNFLTFSRMERGQQQFDFSNVGTDALIEKAVGVFLDHCPKAKECLTIDAQGDAEVSCDQDSMVTAIVNLLENAWKYGGQEKQITLTTNTSNGLAEIKVSDNGIGLSSGEIEKVFDRFYQVDQRVARTQGGCGLGLSIVRSIVEAHDGAVTATSKPNDGSTFVIQLPRAK
jgi:signal transduction histidine kinase